MCDGWRCRFVMWRGCWARDAAQPQCGRDWRSRQNDRRFDTSSPSASPHGDQQLAECMFMLLLFRLAATVNTFHAAWPCRAIGGPLNLFPRRCPVFCKFASLVFFDSAIATLMRRVSHRRRQWGGTILGSNLVDASNSVSICVAGASEGGRCSAIGRKYTKHMCVCCCAFPIAFAG